MAEDWRLTVHLSGDFGHSLGATLHELKLKDETQALLGKQIAVSAKADEVILYADGAEDIAHARSLVEQLLARDGASAEFSLQRWHPLAEEWQDAAAALPASAQERSREQARADQQDAADTQVSGRAEWEVRLDLPSHHAARTLAERLTAEGYAVTRRWRYLLVGAESRGAAQQLAQSLRGELPAGGQLQVHPGGEMAWEAAPARPFLLFVLPS